MEKTAVETLQIKSPAFEHKKNIPSKYTCDGENINPPLEIKELPDDTQSLVLIMDDPDAPEGTFDHWIVWNIPPKNKIKENSIPGTQGKNSFNKKDYGGPCPPSGTHRYFFKIYALETDLDLDENAGKEDVEEAMEGHVLGYGELIGLYSKGGRQSFPDKKSTKF